VIAAVEQAVSAQIGVSAAVAHLLHRSETPSIAPLERWPRLSPPDCSVYSRIGAE
jgi:hypothetical protein